MRSHNILHSEPSHIALIEDIIESAEYGPSSSHVVLDCITFKAARSLKNKTWATMDVGNEALTNTMLLSVSLHDLQRVISFEPDQEQWISFSLRKEGKKQHTMKVPLQPHLSILVGPMKMLLLQGSFLTIFRRSNLHLKSSHCWQD